MPGTNERQKQGEDDHRQADGGLAGPSCSEYLLRNNEIQEIFSRSGWQVRPFYHADAFMAEGVTTLGAWESENQRDGPCFQGSEPLFLVCFLTDAVIDRDSALEKAHAVSWNLGHRILLVTDRCSITVYNSSSSILQNDHMVVLASIDYPGLSRFDNRISELLDSYAEPHENSQDFLCLPQSGFSQATGCPGALVSLVTRLEDALSRKIHSCEPGISGETHEKLVTRLLFATLFVSVLTELYRTNEIYGGKSGQTDPDSLHTTIIRGILEEMQTGPGETVSADNILQITGLLQKEPYKPLILTLVPPRTFSYAFEYLSLIKSGKKTKRGINWRYGKKSLKTSAEGCPRIPDALARYCTCRLTMLLNERKTKNADYPAILDPRCGTGQFLLCLCEEISEVFHDPARETNSGPLQPGPFPCPDTTAEKEKVLHSVYGLDPDPAKADFARFVLFLWLNRHVTDVNYLIRQAGAFFSGRHHIFGTIRNCQFLFAPDLLTDLNRALLGPERAGKIHTFDLDREFPGIAERGGFDAITGNFIYSSHRLSRYIREYLQGHFVSYDPCADCSVYLLEKSVALLKSRGICSAVHNCGWTGASCAGRLRNLISSMQIIEMTEVTKQRHEEVQGRNSGILIFSKEPPLKDIIAAKVTSGSCRDIFRQAHLKRNRIEHPGRGTGGWSFRDPRSIRLRHAIARHGIPLERYAMSELYQGINRDPARHFLFNPENSTVPLPSPGNHELLPFVSGATLCAYCPVTSSGILAVPSKGAGPEKNGPLFRRLNATDLTNGDPDTCYLPVPEELVSLISRIRNYAEMRYKILIPLGIPWPACSFDEAGCIPDESIFFIPHRDLYLLAFLNSVIPEFLMIQRSCDESLKKGCASPQWLQWLPVHVIDGSDEKESRLHDRIVLLAERIISLRTIRVPDTDDRIAGEIDSRVRDAEDEINRCFYSLYGFSEREIEIVRRSCST